MASETPSALPSSFQRAVPFLCDEGGTGGFHACRTGCTRPPGLPALLRDPNRGNRTSSLGFLPGALDSSFSAPNTKRRVPFCIYYPDRCLCAPQILSDVTFSNLVEIAVVEDASAIVNLLSFPVVPIRLLNSIMNEFTGVLLSFGCLKGAIFWSMRQMAERQGELKFTFFPTCLTEYD